MTTKFNRSRYTDLRTDESPWSLKSLALLGAGAVAAIFCLFAMAMLTNAIDQRAEVEQQQLLQLTKAERTSQALPTNLVQAYERGLADAMESINGTPQGVALAQACLAAGVGR